MSIILYNNSSLKIILDTDCVEGLIRLLQQTSFLDREFDKIVELDGTQALIRQSNLLNPYITESVFKSSFKKICEQSNSVEEDFFQFKFVRKRINQIESILQEIHDSSQILLAEVTSQIKKYFPDRLDAELKVYLVIGGGCDGADFEDGTAYIALQYACENIDGLKLLMTHELYHNAQRVMKHSYYQNIQKVDYSLQIKNILQFLDNIVNEGTASLISEPFQVESDGNYTKWLKQKFKRNLDKIEESFMLFETLLYRLYHDHTVEFKYFENIGFSASWDSPLYFVGYQMAKVIEKNLGRKCLIELIGMNPIYFFMNYAKISEKFLKQEIIQFTPVIQRILQEIQDFLDKYKSSQRGALVS